MSSLSCQFEVYETNLPYHRSLRNQPLSEMDPIVRVLTKMLQELPCGLGVPVESDYKFDSHRLTYRYLFYESSTWRFSAGATAFIRDAKVELRQIGSAATDSNVGFMPRCMAVVDVDGLVAPQGRAFDAAQRSAMISPIIGLPLRVIERSKAGSITASGSSSAGSTSLWSRWGIGTKAAFGPVVLTPRDISILSARTRSSICALGLVRWFV